MPPRLPEGAADTGPPHGNEAFTMNDYQHDRQRVMRLRTRLPELIERLQLESRLPADAWQNPDARLLPLLDPDLPLMVAICGGANSGKSTLFNSLLQSNLSAIRGDAGSTRRVLAAGHPELFDQPSLVSALFEPFDRPPEPLKDPAALLETGPPLYIANPGVPHRQVLMDTPDFDTGSADRYINRDIARRVLEASNILIYVVTNATYNNLENTRFMRQMLTEAGMRRCILVYRCSRSFSEDQVQTHLRTTAANLYGSRWQGQVIGWYRTDESDAVAEGKALMQLRAVGPQPEDILALLRSQDPRETRRVQIQSTLAAYFDHARRVVSEGRIAAAELGLYAGALRLALSHAVSRALVSVPIERILQRMNTIWMETSPGYLKFFRGVGSAVGGPARMVVSLVKAIRGEKQTPGADRSERNLREELRANLIQGAAQLREAVLEAEVAAETTADDRDGAALIRALEDIRRQRGLEDLELPFLKSSAATGVVTLHVAAPPATAPPRRRIQDRPWAETAAAVGAAAETVLNVADDVELNRELTELVHDFRSRMSFSQKSRESLFASLNILPATLGIAYILTTGDPVGAGGIYAKLHGLFGMHDLWALVSIPASARMDETARRNLSDMLAPVLDRWLENRARIIRDVFEMQIAGAVIDAVEQTAADAEAAIAAVQQALEAP